MKRGQRMVILGYGAMGSALARGFLRKRLVKAADLRVVDPDPGKRARAKREEHIRSASASEALRGAKTVLLAVKPQQVKAVLADAGPRIPKGALVISIAAGIPTELLERSLPQGCPVVRVMPNTPALLGAGMTVVTGGSRARKSHVRSTLELFRAVGCAVEVREELMDLVTGLSGSGPAYLYAFVEAMAKAGVEGGLSPATSLELAARTVLGAARMILETGKDPASLRAQVTSPGGTTQAGLKTLEERGFSPAVVEAVRSATARAGELRRMAE